MNRKYKLTSKKRFYSFIIVLTLSVSAIFFAATAYGYEGPKYDIVRVHRGDTLWNIAGKYCKSGDIRHYIYEIKKANNMEDSIIFEGTDLKIPV